jgi:hypothetical protein
MGMWPRGVQVTQGMVQWQDLVNKLINFMTTWTKSFSSGAQIHVIIYTRKSVQVIQDNNATVLKIWGTDWVKGKAIPVAGHEGP